MTGDGKAGEFAFVAYWDEDDRPWKVCTINKTILFHFWRQSQANDACEKINSAVRQREERIWEALDRLIKAGNELEDLIWKGGTVGPQVREWYEAVQSVKKEMVR